MKQELEKKIDKIIEKLPIDYLYLDYGEKDLGSYSYFDLSVKTKRYGVPYMLGYRLHRPISTTIDYKKYDK